MLHRFPTLPFFAPDDLAPPGGNAGGKGVTCEFCKCRLSGEGDVMKRSERAKALMDVEEKLDTATATVTEQKATIAELHAKIKELEKTSPAPQPAAANEWP